MDTRPNVSNASHEDHHAIPGFTTKSPPSIVPSTSPSSHSLPRSLRPRKNTASIDTAIAHPGSVRINVQEAYIVESDDVLCRSASHSPERPLINAGSASKETRDIRLPHHTAVVSHVAVDIGGTLAKLVYFSREPCSPSSSVIDGSSGPAIPGGRLNFLSFETDRIADCLAFLQTLKLKQQPLNGSSPSSLCVMATGGGAYKYYSDLKSALGGVEVLREDEMECLIIGLDFFITEIPNEVFTYSDTEPLEFQEPHADIYPYLLVNIGSGVSMIKVMGPRKFERIGGTSLGGGTLWGLLSLLTGARTFDEMLDGAAKGDNSRVDMLVGDIYGMDYGRVGLKSSTIASSFGKVFREKKRAEGEAEDGAGLGDGDPVGMRGSAREGEPEEKRGFRSDDISRSLLYAISNNIGQLAYLHSSLHSLPHIYFGGSFIRGHRQTMNTLSYAIRFWSKGAKKAYFLRHEGYLGAVGAFLKRQPRNWGRRNSFEDVRPS